VREKSRCGVDILSRSVASASVAMLAFSPALPGATGCTTHQCDADCVVIGAAPDALNCPGANTAVQGDARVDGNDIVWESTGTGDPWLDFPGQRTYEFKWRAAFESAILSSPMASRFSAPGSLQAFVDLLPLPYDTQAYVANGQVDAQDSTFVEAAGQLAYMHYVGPDQLNVFNATCALYSLRVVVRVSLATPVTGDAGTLE
jgi:hypothetical protein